MNAALSGLERNGFFPPRLLKISSHAHTEALRHPKPAGTRP